MSTSPQPVGGERPAARDSIEAQFLPLIDQLDLEPLQKEFLRRRWLDQVRWNDGRSVGTQRWYRLLRLVTILGGVVIPALVGLNVSGAFSARIRWTVFGIGLVVAVAAAIEGFFQFGERWSHYRSAAELLQSEGWQFFQLIGRYNDFTTHAGAFGRFAAQVEAVIQQDVDAYFTTVVTEQPQQATGTNQQATRGVAGSIGGPT
jgi:hypothetical protein